MTHYHVRSALKNFEKALQKKELKIGFLGGSITENKVSHNWPEEVIAFLLNQDPSIRLSIFNLAIGATGSDIGCMIAHELVAQQCDMVFIEYAVNDDLTPSQRRIDQMEGLIRILLKQATIDLVLVYTFYLSMYPDYQAHQIPHVIKDFEGLANQYHINSVHAGAYVLEKMNHGLIRMDSFLPDGVHPGYIGSHFYAEAIIGLLKDPLIFNHSRLINRIFNPSNPWETGQLLPLQILPFSTPFYLRNIKSQGRAQYEIFTAVPEASFTFEFYGTGLVLVFDFGKLSGEVMIQVDDLPPSTSERDRPEWVGDSGWLRPIHVIEKLPLKIHRCAIKNLKSTGLRATGTHFRLTHVWALGT